MKVKIQTTFPKKTIEVDNVFFSSDLHLGHQGVIDFGRAFHNIDEMNFDIMNEINSTVKKNDLLVLLGDTMMGEKNYAALLNELICDNIIIVFGNHCNRGKLEKAMDYQAKNFLHIAHYVELTVDKQYICCSHYPMFHWNYQSEGSWMLHGHLHGDESNIIKEIHKYKSMDVGVDAYYNLYSGYSIFSFEHIHKLLKDKLIIGRH